MLDCYVDAPGSDACARTCGCTTLMRAIGDSMKTSAQIDVNAYADVQGWEDGYLVIRDGPLRIRIHGKFIQRLKNLLTSE